MNALGEKQARTPVPQVVEPNVPDVCLLDDLAPGPPEVGWIDRATVLLMPLMMFAAVVLTANHYIIDAIVGGIIAMAAIWLATMLHRHFERTRGHAVLV